MKAEGGSINGENEGRKKEYGPPNLHHRSTPLVEILSGGGWEVGAGVEPPPPVYVYRRSFFSENRL